VKKTGSNNQIHAVVRAILGGVSATAMSAPLFAQTAPAADQTGQKDQLQEVVVTGIRASLQKSMEIKQDTLGVVDAVSSEDIGQFPDANIGDAIARIPGVTVNRGNLNQASAAGAPTATGATQGITIRGFGETFNEVLIDGRPIASGNGQQFNFSDFSAIYVNEIVVHKTPDMSLSSGAIGGTVNVIFPKPFDHPGFQAQFFGQGNMYQMDGGVKPGFGALLSDTFADNTFGILVAGNYLDSHILGHHQDIVGWKGVSQNTNNGGYLACSSFAVNPAGSGCASVGTGAAGNSKVPTWYPQDMAMYLERTNSIRKDARVAIQWRPAENVVITADWNYSSDDERDNRWQRSTWFGAFPSAIQDGNGTLTSFNYTGPTDFNAFVADNYITTSTPGINVKWDISDRWSTALDGSLSESKYNPNGTYSDIDSDVGYGNGTNNYTGGLILNPNNKVLPYWSAYGPNTTSGPPGSPAVASPNYNGLNPFIVGSHVFPIQTQVNSDKVTQVKLDATWKTDSTRVNFGLQFVDDLWNTNQMDTFTNNYWQLWSGYGPASNNAVGQPLPPSFFSPVNLGTWMPGYTGAGNLPSSLLIYNPYTVLNYLMQKPANAGFTPSNGAPPWTQGTVPAQQLNPSTVQHVDRTSYSPFAVGMQDLKLGDDMHLIINLGLRYQRTNETIAGLAAPLNSMTWQGAGDPTAYAFNLGSTTWTETTNHYGYFLPSLDLNLLVTPNFKIRADASRTLVAPANQDLIPNTSYGGRVNALTATGNNPGLLPYLSNNFDLGAEWYYQSNSYVSVDGFFKNVSNFPTSSVQPLVPGVIDPAPAVNPVTGQPLSNTSGQPAVFAETTFTNAESAKVHGIEATWQHYIGMGFGFQINGTYAHTDQNFNPYSLTSNQFALPGVGSSANFIGYYQAHGFQARIAVQWQDTQLLGLGQEQTGGAFGAEPVYLKANTEVDFTTQYQFTKNFAGYFEALNLTDNIYHTYGRFSNQTLNLVEYGRSFTLGIRAKFD
jgi:TonB-dependent receptor